MKKEISCGIIPVYQKKDGSYEYLLVQGHGGFWGFPKGHKEGTESHKETALRELFEETGIFCSHVFGNMLTETYIIHRIKKEDTVKKVVYFIGLVTQKKVQLQRRELYRYGWFSLEDAKKKVLESRQILLDDVDDILKEKNHDNTIYK
jgi:bis(5'-nucleosidyl)-tetraphosphatase